MSQKDLDTLLQNTRQEIDEIDGEIMELLGQRMKLSEKVAKIKKDVKSELRQPKRWQELMEKRKEMGGEIGLSQEFIEKVWDYIHEESIKKQEEVLSNNNS